MSDKKLKNFIALLRKKAVYEGNPPLVMYEDPYEVFNFPSDFDMQDALGPILDWLVDSYMNNEPWAVGVIKRYQFPTPALTSSKVDDAGYLVSKDKEDEDLSPILFAIRNDSEEIFLFYQYAICAFISPEGEQLIVRMD